MANLFDLTGRTAVVTGSAQGMGRAMAIALAEAGADLVLLDRNEPGIEATAHNIRQLGRKALPIIPMDGGNLAMNGGGGLLGPIMERHGLKR